MAIKTRNKEHHDDAVVYDALTILSFDTVTPPASQANSAIAGQLPLPVCCKIFAVTIVQVGSVNVTAFNVVSGAGVDGSPNNSLGTPDTSDSFQLVSAGGVTGGAPPVLAAQGTALFVADQAVTLTASVPQTFFNSNFDVIFPSAQAAAANPSLGAGAGLLTLRLVTNTGTGGACKVQLLVKAYDIHQYTPRTTSFLPSNDIA